MVVYDVFGTQEDCYPNTTVLINRFDMLYEADTA